MTAHGFASNGRVTAKDEIMTIYTAKELAKITGLQPKHVWANVKQCGITPQKANGVNVLDDAQLKTYTERRASEKKTGRVNTRFTQGATASATDKTHSRAAAKAALMVARARRGLTGVWLVDWKHVAPF